MEISLFMRERCEFKLSKILSPCLQRIATFFRRTNAYKLYSAFRFIFTFFKMKNNEVSLDTLALL